jgi:hypothetical protein
MLLILTVSVFYTDHFLNLLTSDLPARKLIVSLIALLLFKNIMKSKGLGLCGHLYVSGFGLSDKYVELK